MSVEKPDPAVPSRRDVLKVAAAVTGGAALGLTGATTATAATAATRPGPRSPRTLVGAIRWDAYTGGTTRFGMGANRMLSPEEYRFRMPFYSDITVPDPVLLHDASTEGGSATLSHRFAGQNRAITVKWDWKESTAGGWPRVLVTGGSTVVLDIATREVADGKQLVCRTPTGDVQVVQTVADNTWYSMKVVIDPAPPEAATPWADIFVDGVRGAYHVPLLGAPAVLDTLHFQTDPALATDVSVDNVSVEVTESVNADGTSQAIMDQEIQFASDAGIDYWAFDYYPQQPLGRARELYLSSTKKHLINWCAILDGNFGYGADFDANLAVLVARMAESNYQKVLGTRPLVYIIAGATAGRVTAIRTKAAQAGLGDPYVVVTGWTAQSASGLKTTVGADAVSRYATGPATPGAPYSSITEAESALWSEYAAAGGQVVPTVSTGWDPRPRHDYPAPWGAQPDTSYLTDDDFWSEQGTPEQIAVHLKNAVHWTKTHSPVTAANSVLIYAWNENLEGGWICPTLYELRYSGRPLRLDAIANALRTA
ncbi:hypothetical protein ACQHIV_21365 [Kribbella sp. GL6]|uniref:hypothetical protein n=1 Tax=Kribbella sp. GL6 TaxID=3419765 RepID=UPI003CFC1E89